MLTNLFLAAAVTALPPWPTSSMPHSPLLSPKHQEYIQSLGKPIRTARIIPIRATALAPPQGFSITNITVNAGNVSLGWSEGTPPYQVQATDLSGQWVNIAGPTTASDRTFSESSNRFFRVQGSIILPLTLDADAQPRIQWDVPELDMSDSLGQFTVQRRSDEPPAGQAISDDAGWTAIAGSPFPSSTRQANESSALPEYYRVKQTTANGVVVPYAVRSLTNVDNGSFVSALTATSDLYGNVRRVAVDANSRIAFAGHLLNFVNWGNGQITSAGGKDSMVGTITNAQALWTKAIGTIQDGEQAQAAVFDSSRNLWVFGHFGAHTAPGEDFGGQSLISVSSSPTTDLYLVKYDTANPPAILSLTRFGPASGTSAQDMAIDSNGNLYLAVNCNASTTFGAFTLAAGYGIVKLNSAGVAQWATQVGTSGDHSIVCIAVEPDGSAIAIGGTVFGANNNAYIQRYSSSGALSFERVFTSSSPASATTFGIAIDSTTHRIIATGKCGASTDFGGAITDFFGNTNASPGTFLASYSSANGFVWARTPNVSGYNPTIDQGFAVVTDPATGNIFFCGQAGGAIYFGNADNLILLGGQNSFLASVSSIGAPRWGYRSGGASGYGECLAIAPNNRLVMGGQVSNGTMTFHGNSGGSVSATSGKTAPFVAVFNR